MADTHGGEEQEIEENLAVNSPSDTHQGLEHTAADVKRDEQEAF